MKKASRQAGRRKSRAEVWRSADGSIELHRGCGLALLAEVNEAACCITDPPYGATDLAWDQQPDLATLGEAIGRAVIPAATIVLFAAQPFATEAIVAWRSWFRYDLVWEKPAPVGFLNAKRKPLRAHELMLVFQRATKGATYNPQFTFSTPYHVTRHRGTGIYGKQRDVTASTSADGRRYPRSVLKFGESRSALIHPTQKPLALVRWLVRAFTHPGELVIDPYVGSATTAAACLLEGRRFIGAEIDRTYFRRAVARLTALDGQEETHARREA